jgi:hypothetical protein
MKIVLADQLSVDLSKRELLFLKIISLTNYEAFIL